MTYCVNCGTRLEGRFTYSGRYIMDQCPKCGTPLQSSDTTAKKDGYESVQELFEDNYHEDPTYETSVNDGTEVEE